MKTIISALFAAFLLSTNMFSQGESKKPVKTEYSVSIDCQKCVTKITNALAFERGVRDLQFSIENKTVEVTYRPDRISKATIEQKIKDLNFEIEEIKKD